MHERSRKARHATRAGCFIQALTHPSGLAAVCMVRGRGRMQAGWVFAMAQTTGSDQHKDMHMFMSAEGRHHPAMKDAKYMATTPR